MRTLQRNQQHPQSLTARPPERSQDLVRDRLRQLQPPNLVAPTLLLPLRPLRLSRSRSQRLANLPPRQTIRQLRLLSQLLHPPLVTSLLLRAVAPSPRLLDRVPVPQLQVQSQAPDLSPERSAPRVLLTIHSRPAQSAPRPVRVPVETPARVQAAPQGHVRVDLQVLAPAVPEPSRVPSPVVADAAATSLLATVSPPSVKVADVVRPQQ